MEIARPFLLLLLLLLPLLYYGHRRSLVDLPRVQRHLSLMVRSCILILLALSLADVQYLKKSHKFAIAFLVDLSDSISEEGLNQSQKYIQEAMKYHHDRADQMVSVILFTAQARILRRDEAFPTGAGGGNAPPLREIKARWLREEQEVGDATNIAGAIETAWGVFPTDASKRIILLTDGVETEGDALQTGLRGKTFGVQIDTVPIYPPAQHEVTVERIDAPVQVKQGEPFHLEVLIHSNHEDFSEIRLFKNKFEVAKQEVRLKSGENRVVFSQTLTESGTLTYEAFCRSTQDTRYDNNNALGIITVSGKPKVLLIEENESQARYLARALEDSEIQVDVRNGLGVPTELSDLQNYELLIFSDVPASRLSQKQMELIRTYVQDLGGGFMMLGGENSFGLGGYYKTPIEEILPLRTDTEKKKETPSIGMVLVIDKSGSMEGMKIELAKAAARATVELLGPRDQIGIIAFDGSPHWIAEMHSASDKLYVSDQIGSLSAGGGTNLYPALQQAYLALTETSAKLKHVIVLTDGQSEPGDWYGIVTAMHAERITVSTVGIGSDADMNLLSNIANWGGGRDYFTQDAYSVPQIFAKETVTASKSAIVEEPFLPQVIKPTQVLKGINLETAPSLLGYVSTQPKPTADVFLVSERGEPLLASWQYGLGKSVAFTSDAKLRWASEWLEWAGFGKFWAQLVRDTLRKSTMGNFQSRIDQKKGIAHLTIDALSETGDFLNKLESDMTLIPPDHKKEQLSMTQTAPGKYELDFPVKGVGPYFVNILQKQHGEIVNSQTIGTVVSYPDEYVLHNANESLLAQLASLSGGTFNPSAEKAFRAPEHPVLLHIHLWRSFLIIAAFLLIVDIALRRIDLRGKLLSMPLMLFIFTLFLLLPKGNAQPQAIEGAPKAVISLEGEVLTPDHSSTQVAVPIQVVSGGKVIATTLSDERGNFQFTNLKPGAYQVRCQTLGGYVYYGDRKDAVVVDALHAKSVIVERGKPTHVHFHVVPFKKGTWKNYTYLDGLAANNIVAIHRDPDGTMWFGTEGGGVSQYDGRVFVNLTQKDGLSDNDVYAIYRAPDGVLWFGTHGGGVSQYDGKGFVNLTTQDGLVDDHVHTIYRDPDGVMWFGTDGGVSQYNGKGFINLTTQDGLVNNGVRVIHRDADGTMWFGTKGGVSRYDGKNFINFTTTDGLAHNDVYAIYRDSERSIWFGTHGGGVSQYDPPRSPLAKGGSKGGFVNLTVNDGLADNRVHVIYRDSDGVLWFGTDGGASRYDGKGFVNLTANDGLVDNRVHAIQGDPDGGLWFGTEGGGVSQYDEKGFINFTTTDGLVNNEVNVIYGDPGGVIWIGTLDGVSQYNGKGFVNLTTTDGLVNNVVRAIHHAPDGMVWFGTDGGVSQYDGKKFVNFTTSDGLASNFVYAIYSDPNGVVWFGTHGGGVSQYDGKKFVNFTTTDGLADNRVHVIYRDAGTDGVIWFGTWGGGVSRYDPPRSPLAKGGSKGGFVNLTTQDGLASNFVNAIYSDRQGELWFGTDNGVSQYNGKNFLNLTAKDGLVNNEVNAIYRDADGVLWVGTDSGVSVYNGFAWTAFDTWEGLVSNSVKTIHQDSNGFLWFGTDRGMTRYRRSRVPPTVRIGSVRIDSMGSERQYTVLSEIPSFTFGSPITIEYQTIDFKTHPQKRQYRCRIREIDPDWRNPTKTTTFEWTPRKAGIYTFEVQGFDRDVNFSPPASVTLTVVPPFYMRAGFLVLVVSVGTILLATLTILFIVFVKHRRRIHAYQQAAVQELREAREMQMSLLPKTSPQIEGIEIAGVCLPANTVSGDFFDYLTFGDDALAIVLADVTGKGLKGAMNAVLSYGALHAEAKLGVSPAQMLWVLNRDLQGRFQERTNCAMCLATIAPGKGGETPTLLRYANAGIPYPMVKRGGEVLELECNGMPLGGLRSAEYQEVTIELQAGDGVVFFSDGVTEAPQKDGPERLYMETNRLFSLIKGLGEGMAAQEMVDAILADLRDFSGDANQNDDITVVVVKVQ